jgi:membrane protease YdiL (CAAX protease family)
MITAGEFDAADGEKISRPGLGLLSFLLVAFGVPWAGWVIERRSIGLDHLFDSFETYWFTAAPSVAAFIAAAAEGGLGGLRAFAARVFNLRFSPSIWLLALALPLSAATLTFATHPSDLGHGGSPKFAAALATVSWINFFTGPIAEEFGWRGYLLGYFRRRHSPVLAGLIIGPIWAAWHIPIFYDNLFTHLSSSLVYVGWITAWSVVLALIVDGAQGSVLPSILSHWFLNALPPIFFALLPALPGERQPGGIRFSMASIMVAAVAVLAWRCQGDRDRARTEVKAAGASKK